MQAKRIVVVGAGPAGMICAIRAAELGGGVTLIEKNPHPGQKLLLSGKGRCNLTNLCDLGSFFARFSSNSQFLRDAFRKFFNRELMNFFESRGLKLKVERQLRVFPESGRSESVVEVLKKELQKNKVKVLCNSVLKDIILRDNRVKAALLGDGRNIPADRIILACGGVSYGFTGSTGEGIGLARKLGHTIVPFRPGLVPLEVRQPYPKVLAGLTLKNIRLKFTCENHKIISEVGELLFTHFGISGPLVLTLSGKIADWLTERKHVQAEIDLKPGLAREQLNARLLREFSLNSKKSLKNVLKSLLPRKLIDVFIELCDINPLRKANQVGKEERENLLSLFKGLKLDITKARPIAEAMVTRGGVSLREINPRTMESRRIKGLYFCGEMIDIDADTGGFNLQAAFSTGYLAGESAALCSI